MINQSRRILALIRFVLFVVAFAVLSVAFVMIPQGVNAILGEAASSPMWVGTTISVVFLVVCLLAAVAIVFCLVGAMSLIDTVLDNYDKINNIGRKNAKTRK